MNARMPVYRFGFRLACLIAMLIALSIMAMTYFFITREPEAVKEISRWFEKIVMALVALLGGIVFRALPLLSYAQQTSGTRRNRSLSSQSKAQLREQSTGTNKTCGKGRSKGKDNGVRSRRRRDPQMK
jgi:hypothetical protein